MKYGGQLQKPTVYSPLFLSLLSNIACCTQALAVKYGGQLQMPTLAAFVEEAAPLINDADLTLASAALSNLLFF